MTLNMFHIELCCAIFFTKFKSQLTYPFLTAGNDFLMLIYYVTL